VIPVVSPEGVGETGSLPGVYRLLPIGDDEYAIFWIAQTETVKT
jgi:hypothetical protein